MPETGEERARRIVELVATVEAIPDPVSRTAAQSLMQAILELHGAGIDRMIEIVLDSGEAGKAAVRRFAGDSLVSSLLVLHDLHPDDIETRIRRALARTPGSAELIGVFDGTVRIRVAGSGCGLKEAIATAVREAAADATEIIIDEAVPPSGFVPIEALCTPVAAM